MLPLSEREVVIMFGPPGTGKTTSLLQEVDRYLNSGGRPDRITYCAFTRKAADEAAVRAAAKFGLDRDSLPFFRTLHSIAYRELELGRDDVMSKKDWKEFGEFAGLETDLFVSAEAERFDTMGANIAEKLFGCYALARARQHSVTDEYINGNYKEIPLWAIEEFTAKLDHYKESRGKLDFTDFLDRCTASLECDLFILDEAQDLTPQQWMFARQLARNAKRVVIAGDDDQAIYDWAGADSSQMRKFNGQQIVLPKSYRLPRQIHSLAQKIVTRIRYRVPKVFEPKDEEGELERISDLGHADLTSGGWLVLCRHRRGMDRVEAICRQQGIVYSRDSEWSNTTSSVRAVVLYEQLRRGNPVTLGEARLVASMVLDMARPLRGDEIFWEDLVWAGPAFNRAPWFEGLTRLGGETVAYIRALLRSGESLNRPGRVILSTIHGAKGGEADNVLLLDGANKRVRDIAELDPDAENRVWYVGVSRARKKLVVAGDSFTNAL